MKIKYDRRCLGDLESALEMITGNMVPGDCYPVPSKRYTTSTQTFTDEEVRALGRLLTEVRLSNAIYEFESCPKCGSESIEWTEGFPGESVLMCQSCKEVLDSRFCEEQIM